MLIVEVILFIPAMIYGASSGGAEGVAGAYLGVVCLMVAINLCVVVSAVDGKMKDLDLLLELAASMGSMPGNNICGLSDGTNWAIRTIMNKFWGEFEAAVKKPTSVSLSVVGAGA